MLNLTEILKSATRSIEEKYFRLPIERGTPEYKERVYCYELYHQMRCQMHLFLPSDRTYTLNAEVDKRAHPTLSTQGVSGIPDLLIHTPGDNSGNYAIIEVKSPKALNRLGELRRDLKKLTTFVNKAEYKRAIYLVFGKETAPLIDQIERAAAELPDLAEIELWAHDCAGCPAREIKTFEAKKHMVF